MHTVPTKGRMTLVQTVQVSAAALSQEHAAKARGCARMQHEYLPEHFPNQTEMVLVGDYVLVDITLRMLRPRELFRAQSFPESYIINEIRTRRCCSRRANRSLIRSPCPASH